MRLPVEHKMKISDKNGIEKHKAKMSNVVTAVTLAETETYTEAEREAERDRLETNPEGRGRSTNTWQ